MNTRARFPYEPDKVVIRMFLLGIGGNHDESYLTSEDGKLKLHGIVIAGYDTAGALYVVMPGEVGQTLPFYVELAANYLLEELGVEDRVGREQHREAHDPHLNTVKAAFGSHTWRWTYEGRYAAPNEPLMLCGRLGVEAHRAEKRRM